MTPLLFLEIMMEVRQGEDIIYIQPFEVLAVGWIQLLHNNAKIADGPHFITVNLISPVVLALCDEVHIL